MSAERPQRSAVVFGARNLGRAVIELLTAEGWGVVGVARSQSTLDRVAASGAVALEGDITDAASVRHVLEQAAAVHGRVDLVVNAAAPYGGDRSGPFGGGRLSEATRGGVRAVGGRTRSRGLHVPFHRPARFCSSRAARRP